MDLSGCRFGRLVAIEYVKGGKWVCKCDCGVVKPFITSNLTRGNSTSCGCKTQEARFKHGMAGTPMHHAWRQMFQRCENPKDASFHNYGGRGITICEEWRDFAKFVADMGMRPKGFQIDRIDNDKGYSKGNCRWATAKVNLDNRRNSNLLTYNGETLNVHQWAEKLHLKPSTIRYRIKEGWPVERILSSGYFWSNSKVKEH